MGAEADAAASRAHSELAGRKLVVGMKLTASCREMLTWTVAKLAQPGDHIVALHVAAAPQHPGAAPKEQESHFQQLANTLRGVLSVYEGLCKLKQIKLQVEIVNGVKVREALVEVARSRRACKLILGTNNQFSVGRNTALGKYCAKRLPRTCTVVILEHGDIIFDKKGTLGDDATRSGMLKVLRRSMRSVGRSSRKEASGVAEKPGGGPARLATAALQRTVSETAHDRHQIDRGSSGDVDRCFCSGSVIVPDEDEWAASPASALPSAAEKRNGASGLDALRVSFSRRRAQGVLKASACAAKPPPPPPSPDVGIERADTFLVGDKNDAETVAPAKVHSVKDTAESAPSAEFEALQASAEDVLVPGWPLLHHTIGFDTTARRPAERDLSVVKWALQLPERGDPAGAAAPTGAAIAHGDFEKPSVDGAGAGEHEKAEARSPHDDESPHSCARNRDGFGHAGPSLVQRVRALCRDRPCAAFVYSELEAATSSFSPDNVVGRGGGSVVFRGELRDCKLVAVKRLNPGPAAAEELLTDVEINTSLSPHSHVVSLLGYCVDDDAPHLALVYDYLPEGNLEDHLHAPGKGAPTLPWDVRHKVAVGIAKALDYLHDGCPRPVVHRDVKASNILLTADFESQLSDFGLAKWAPTRASHIRCNDVVGTFGYLAPEYFMFGRVNDKTDVYSFGVVLLELITGRVPIDMNRPKGQENLVNWARPLLEERNLDKLVDPRLDGIYDADQMNGMVLAASLCVHQSAHCRPRISRILQLLCDGHGARPEEADPLEEVDGNLEAGTAAPNYDMQTHFALAMLGVDDDDAASQCNSSVHIPHSSKYLEEYLEGRFSRSASFED